jgi:Ni,Fe-hydrogenase maturation factor
MEISKIYIAGNLLVDEDSLPLQMLPHLERKFNKIEFEEYDPTENLPENNDPLIIIDTVKGLDSPRVFENINDFITGRTYSLHDFDLGWQLKLYKKLKMTGKVIIIGVPEKGDLKKITDEVTGIISSLSSKSE